ncbi:hypothetical protein BC831DRAFT_447743 [Entophlyctis helioformis]|nr:hypothetical protein BC831DRAFT_447743 [Entophlyctis helioformis]
MHAHAIVIVVLQQLVSAVVQASVEGLALNMDATAGTKDTALGKSDSTNNSKAWHAKVHFHVELPAANGSMPSTGPLAGATFVDYTCLLGDCVACEGMMESEATMQECAATGFHEQLDCSKPLVNGTVPVEWNKMPIGIVRPEWRSCAAVGDSSAESWRFVRFEVRWMLLAHGWICAWLATRF